MVAAKRREEEPWQLQIFSKSLKKKMKVKVLKDLMGNVEGNKCLLVTSGDNNGAMNAHLKEHGGEWTWAEMEDQSIPAMENLLGGTVHHASPDSLPFASGAFDRVIIVDIHEHLEDVTALNAEIARVVAPGGRLLVSTPNGDTSMPVAVLKRWVGMTPEVYGHVVQGFTATEIENMCRDMGFDIEETAAYSRFFTELAELIINFGYVKILSRRRGGPKVEKGTIAPSSEEQLKSVRKVYRAYAMIYPLVRIFSTLDVLIPGRGGYAIVVAATNG